MFTPFSGPSISQLHRCPSESTSFSLLRHDARLAGVSALVVPPAFLALAAVSVAVMGARGGQTNALAGFFFQEILPLGAAIATASVLGAETTRELQLSLPTPFRVTLARRTLLVLGWAALLTLVGALLAQAADLWHPWYGTLAGQLIWLAPMLALSGIGVLVTGLTARPTVSAAIVAGLWCVEDLDAHWFLTHGWARLFFLFPDREDAGDTPAWVANRLALMCVGLVGLLLAWAWVQVQARLLKDDVPPSSSAGHTPAMSDSQTGVAMPMLRSATRWASPPSPAFFAVVRSAACHEFAMQLRKPTLWIGMLILGLLFLTTPVPGSPSLPLRADLGQAAVKLNWLGPLLIGCLLADRLVRDRRLGVEELLNATPARLGPRLWGKYLGTVGGCLVPLLGIWLVTLLRFFLAEPSLDVLPLGLAAFAAIQLPAALFVGAFALVCPCVLGVPLFRALFVGYWLWGNLMSPAFVPTFANTWLTPVGDYARAGLFGGPNFMGGAGAPAGSALAGAIGSISLLVALPVITLVMYQLAVASQPRMRN